MKYYWLLAQINPADLDIPQGDANGSTISTVLRMVFAIFGGVSVIIVTLAGLKYIISQGNPQEVAKAKNTIIYALVGLVISISAFSIITFVLTRI